MQCLGSTVCCEAECVCNLVPILARLNALEELHIELTLGWIGQHRPNIIDCFAQSISPAMHLVSATFITETFIEPDFAGVVGIACAFHDTRELIVMKHGQKRVAVQPNTYELLWVMLRLAGVLCKRRQLLGCRCGAFSISALDDIRNMRVCQDVDGGVGTHTNTIRKTLQILMAKTVGLEEAVNSWPRAMRKGFWRARQCPVTQFIGAIEAIQGSSPTPCNDAAVGILISRA